MKMKKQLRKLFEGLAPMTDKEKKEILKAAEARKKQDAADYIRGGHTGFMGGHWTGD